MIWPILLVTLIVGGLFVPELFRNLRSFELVLYASVPLGLLVLAESICLLSGHFDLSIGAIAGFSAVFTGMLIGECTQCWAVVGDPYLAMGIILVVGGFIGFINGVMIAKLNVNPFLQTLAFLIIFTGAKTALTTQPVRALPEEYLFLGRNSLYAIGLMIAVFLLFAFIMRYTNFGQSVYAVGSSETSARAVGVNTDRIIIAVYVISGVLAALAGLMLTGYSTIVPPDIAENMVFPAFAAAVIGGVRLFGGRGRISGALGVSSCLASSRARSSSPALRPPRSRWQKGLSCWLRSSSTTSRRTSAVRSWQVVQHEYRRRRRYGVRYG
jgi:ribose/xylose/arabinose/galactoside ABC-type transport system permease subunit